MTLSLAFLLLLSPSGVEALRKPDPIRNEEDARALGEVQKDIDAARELGRKADRLHEWLRLMDSPGGPDPVRILAVEREWEALERRRDLTYTKAAHQTIRVYDLKPSKLAGRHWNRSEFEGIPAHWIVVAGDREPITLMNKDGEYRYVPAPELGTYAATYPNGLVVLYPEAFSRIGFLAAIIWHEKIHFEQDTDERRAKLGGAQSQIEALRGMLQNRGVFGLIADEQRFIEDQIRTSEGAPDVELDQGSPSGIQPSREMTEGPVVRGPESLAPVPCDDDGAPLAGFAVRACDSPATINQGQMERIWECVSKNPPPADAEQRFGLSHCEKNVYRRLKEMRIRGMRAPTTEWLRGYVENISALRPVQQQKATSQPTPVVQPVPEDEGPERGRPDVPECLRQEGGRCIRWR